MDELLNQTLGPYQIISIIGRGGMGVVYKALQPSLNRYVAIKVLPEFYARDEEFIQRFKREAAIAASLRHPNILTIHDVGQQKGLHYIVMEYLEGRDLDVVIEQEGISPIPRCAHIVAQIASALDHAHERNIIHRDIKPGNIFIGPNDHATLMDFGIVKALDGTRLTRTGIMMGTPEYMSPEQIEGRPIDHRSDLYSLGVVLFYMLTGRAPFEAGTPSAVLYAHVHKPPPHPSQLNQSIFQSMESIMLKALEKDPANRYQSGAEMATDLIAEAKRAEEQELENLYNQAKQLMDDGNMEAAQRVWERLRLIKPDYKDAAVQFERTEHYRAAAQEYGQIAEILQSAQDRMESFKLQYPDYPVIEGKTTPEQRPTTSNPIRTGIAIGGVLLLIIGAWLLAEGTQYAQVGLDTLLIIDPDILVNPSLPLVGAIDSYAVGNFDMGLGIGLGAVGLILILVFLVLFILERRSK